MQVASKNNQANPVKASVATPTAPAPTPVAKAPKTKEKKSLFSFMKKSEKKEENKIQRPKGKKQIPTILGLLILIGSLGAGVMLFGEGTGVFAPRATAQTTPKNIRVSNVTDKSFTISFYTDEATVAFVKYGETGERLESQASDDRDQLSGIVKAYNLHHVTVRGLQAGTTYDYVLGTGSNTFDSEGENYSIATAVKPAISPPNNQTIYGTVKLENGLPAEGSIVYLYHDQMGTLSTLVKSSGSWGVSLANAFTIDKTNYTTLTDESALQLKIQGIQPTLISNWQTTIMDAQPVQDLVLGKDNEMMEEDDSSSTADTEGLLDEEESFDSSPGAEYLASESSSADLTEPISGSESTESSAGSLGSILDTPLETEQETLDLSLVEENQEASATTITTTQPKIKTTLPANTTIRVTIHSDTQIDQTMQTDENGDLIVDVASLGENLEPGEHTATYSYIDPITGQEVTKTYNFTVDPSVEDSQQLASADLSPSPSIPYGSGNPYVPSPTVPPVTTPTATSTPTASPTAVSTSSGQYNAGSVGTTMALLFVGLFFVTTGVWSYWLANQFDD